MLALTLPVASTLAQCAMCRLNAENASKQYQSGLNGGIVYMIFIPYLLIMVGVLVFWRRKIMAFFRS
ncbi:MAG: hypothetical protein JNM00_03450 [Flavobacteriales bacterium]|nr:hypothetical protein [Flavobacteriales bacterium]